MTRDYTRYDRVTLEEAVKTSKSYAETARKLGKKPVGGVTSNLKRMCMKFGLDTSHMTGQGHNKAKPSGKRLLPEQRLVLGVPNQHRIAAQKLRKALVEIGVEEICIKCKLTEWMGHPMPLEVDHINGQYWDNRPENLQIVCPNCHTLKTMGY